MSWIPRGVRRAFRLEGWTREQVGRELDDELDFHLAMRVEELTAAGWSPEAARAEAGRRFGDVEDARRYCRSLDERGARDIRRREWAYGWGQDLRFALRQLRRAPAMAMVAVFTLSLGIGATTAIFSVVHRLMLTPLPYPDADRIVVILREAAKGQVSLAPTPELVDAWRDGTDALAQIGMYSNSEMQRTDSRDPEKLHAVRLSPEMMPVLGAHPALGRSFLLEETQPGNAPVAMLGYGYWKRAFGGRMDVLGQSIALDGRSHTIVGVLPRDFALPSFTPVRGTQVAVPLVADSTVKYVSAIGRLQPETSKEVASEQLTAVMQGLADDQSELTQMTASARQQKDLLGRRTRHTLLVLLGAVGVVLLMACANAAGLLLARAASRQQELAVRAALGAGRRRLVRQLLTESALLGAMGGVGGLAVAWLALRTMIALRPPSLDELEGVRLDPAILLGALALALVTSVLFGLAPAILGATSGLRGSLAGGSRSSTGDRGMRRLRAALVGGEVALSVVLLVCGGLLLRSVLALQATDVGFDPRNLIGASVHLPVERYPAPESRPAVYAQLLERVRAIPGIIAATSGSDVPPNGGIMFGELEIDGLEEVPGEAPTTIGFDQIQPEYFSLIRTPVVAGSVPTDTAGSPIVINESFARRYWPDGNAVGARLHMRDNAPWFTVVGVVGDVRTPGSQSIANELRAYMLDPGTFEHGFLLFRTSGEVPRLGAELARAAAEIDPAIKVDGLRTAEEVIDQTIAGPRFSMALLGTFALIALVLAIVGLYGVISLAVTQRTREFGVRMALGASPRGVTGMVVRQAMTLAGGGLAVGLVVSLGAVRIVRGMLYGIEPLDLPSFAAAAVLLGCVAVAAAYIPARRAARVDPATALRSE